MVCVFNLFKTVATEEYSQVPQQEGAEVLLGNASGISSRYLLLELYHSTRIRLQNYFVEYFYNYSILDYLRYRRYSNTNVDYLKILSPGTMSSSHLPGFYLVLLWVGPDAGNRIKQG